MFSKSSKLSICFEIGIGIYIFYFWVLRVFSFHWYISAIIYTYMSVKRWMPMEVNTTTFNPGCKIYKDITQQPPTLFNFTFTTASIPIFYQNGAKVLRIRSSQLEGGGTTFEKYKHPCQPKLLLIGYKRIPIWRPQYM